MMGSEIFKIKAVMAEKFEYKNDNSILWLMILGYHIFILKGLPTVDSIINVISLSIFKILVPILLQIS